MTPSARGHGGVAAILERPVKRLSDEQEKRRTAAERSLWGWNLAMGFMHLAWTIACLVIGMSDTRAGLFRVPTVSTFPEWTDQGPVPALQVRYAVPFTAITSGFAGLSALAHFLVLVFFKTYVRDLRRGINRFRWFEYAASSSLMIILIGMLFGVWEVHVQFLMGAVNACMNFFGYAHEVQNTAGEPIDWSCFMFGSFAGACIWAVVLSFTFSVNVGGVPDFVWAILAVYFFFFNTFPVNLVLQYKQVGAWYKDSAASFPGSGYYFGEKIYQVLSLLSKSFLLWLVVGGTSQPSTSVDR